MYQIYRYRSKTTEKLKTAITNVIRPNPTESLSRRGYTSIVYPSIGLSRILSRNFVLLYPQMANILRTSSFNFLFSCVNTEILRFFFFKCSKVIQYFLCAYPVKHPVHYLTQNLFLTDSLVRNNAELYLELF